MEHKKIIITAIISAFTSWLGILAVPVYLLLLFNVMDYITGIMAAKSRGHKISSYKGFMGIAKKVSMYLLIIVAAGIDALIMHVGQVVGLEAPFSFAIACIVAVWLVLNEAISILENLADIGVKMPPFLMPLIGQLKSKIEETTEIKEENDHAVS